MNRDEEKTLQKALLDHVVQGEAGKTYKLKAAAGFIEKYLSGGIVLDVGFRGHVAGSVPITPYAVGVDLDYPGYDGLTLPFHDETVDAIFSSHVLEHVENYKKVIQDWHRVLKIGGFIVCVVPHQFLYEKRSHPPSKFNGDHKRFYTPSSLLHEFEESLQPNSYRVRHLCDNDLWFDYGLGPHEHSRGCYEIELVIEKIKIPQWWIETDEHGSQ
jgi:SAM-dependent methyltransferase